MNLEIRGHAATIVIQVHGYEREQADTESDANWLNATVRATIGGFSGSLSTSITTADFVRFQQDLRSALGSMRGNVVFAPEEEGIELSIEIGRSGTAHVSGQVRSRSACDVALRFRFESDQSFLQLSLTELESLIDAFPKRSV